MKRRVLSVSICVLLCCAADICRADCTDIARLHGELARSNTDVFRGYARTVSGTRVLRRSHRDPRVPALIARNLRGAETIAWQTEAVPAGWQGDAATFLWVCGIADTDGRDLFDLAVNGTNCLSFATSGAGRWHVAGQKRSELRFAGVDRDDQGNRFGYMILRLARPWLQPGKPVELSITGQPQDGKSWILVHEYNDALSYFQAVEQRGVYYDWSWSNYGSVRLSLAAAPELAGQNFALKADGRAIGGGTFRRRGPTAWAMDRLSPETTRKSVTVSVFIGDRFVERFELPDFGERRARAFVHESLEFASYVFPPGDFPSYGWARPGVVENQVGPLDLTATFYDTATNPVTRAETPGRYGAVVEGTTADGYTVRRYVTLYCADPATYRRMHTVLFDALGRQGVASELTRQTDALGAGLRAVVQASAAHCLSGHPSIARYLGGMDLAPEMGATPLERDRQWWIAFKVNEAGDSDRFPPLLRPTRQLGQNALTLTRPKERDPAYDDPRINAIRNACIDWSDGAGAPLEVLVARRGRIVFHEAFGTEGGYGEETASPRRVFPTPLLATCLFLMYVDQGMLSPDSPLARFLPDFEGGGGVYLTFRHLFTHTAGLDRIGPIRSVEAPLSIENRVGYYARHLRIGERAARSELGTALAIAALERISEQSFPEMVRRHIVAPLGLGATEKGTATNGCALTCQDLAILAQALLNEGTYGNSRFFSAETCDLVTPVEESGSSPDLMDNVETRAACGIGTVPAPEQVLGEGAYACDAGAGATIRIAPAYGLVIVVVRNGIEGEPPLYAQHLMEACVAPLETGGIKRK